MIEKGIYLGGFFAKNRIWRSATNDYRGNEDGTVSEEQLAIYETLAKDSIGVIVSGNFTVSIGGRIDDMQNALITTRQKEYAKTLVSLVHSYDKPFLAQLVHAGNKSKVLPMEKPPNVNSMEVMEIWQCMEHFAMSTQVAKKCGFDGVQIHLSHGYLLSDFLNPLVNKRKDSFGLQGDCLYLLEGLFHLIREYVGEDYPIFAKISSCIEGVSLEENKKMLQKVVENLDHLGVAGIELSGTNLSGYKKTDHLYYLDYLSECRPYTKVPLILTGGIRSLEESELALEKGADMVGFSRPFIRNHTFAKDLLEGATSQCISCNACYGLKEKGKKRCAFTAER